MLQDDRRLSPTTCQLNCSHIYSTFLWRDLCTGYLAHTSACVLKSDLQKRLMGRRSRRFIVMMQGIVIVKLNREKKQS